MSPCIYLRQAFSHQHRSVLASRSVEQNRKIKTVGPVVFLQIITEYVSTFTVTPNVFRITTKPFVFNFVGRRITKTSAVIGSHFETNINKSWGDNSCTDYHVRNIHGLHVTAFNYCFVTN